MDRWSNRLADDCSSEPGTSSKGRRWEPSEENVGDNNRGGRGRCDGGIDGRYTRQRITSNKNQEDK